jgi:hypothetical protein
MQIVTKSFLSMVSPHIGSKACKIGCAYFDCFLQLPVKPPKSEKPGIGIRPIGHVGDPGVPRSGQALAKIVFRHARVIRPQHRTLPIAAVGLPTIFFLNKL